MLYVALSGVRRASLQAHLDAIDENSVHAGNCEARAQAAARRLKKDHVDDAVNEGLPTLRTDNESKRKFHDVDRGASHSRIYAAS